MKNNIFIFAKSNGVDLEEVAEKYELKTRFNKKAVDEAQKADIKDEDYRGREDFRDYTVFTIDGDDSRDFDDAVGIQKHENGYTLFVHIADVSHYVKQGTALDKEALKRGTSVYFPFGCLPMLPAKLSDDICSLRPNEDRLTLSVVMEINNNGSVVKTRIVEGVINSSARLTYKIAQSVIDGNAERGISDKIAQSLKAMGVLAHILIDKRAKSGTIDLDSAECEFVFNGEKAESFAKRERLFSHRIIEEFMILANESVARKIVKKTPFLYRVHDAPSPQKAQRLADFLFSRGIDFAFDTIPTVNDLKEILDNCEENLKPVLGMMVLRTMSKAVYSPFRKHHFGLNLDYYCHFTSPIRRYPDLFIHRVIKAIIKGGGLKNLGKGIEELAEHCSKTERLADEAERKVDDALKAECMKFAIGERFDGIISGVTDFGVFVQLSNTAEGLIRIENLPEYLIFDQQSLSLRTRNGKTNYKLGDPMQITVAAVRDGKIEFELAK